MRELEIIKKGIIADPFFITKMNNPIVIEIIDNLIPYSVGIEVECNQGSDWKIEYFKSIPNIMHVQCDPTEQRFRIPSGVDGINCLKEISNNLIEYSELNLGSGIHYHIDMTDCFKLLTPEIVTDNKEWMLKELDTWDYKGTYNTRDCRINNRCWVNFQSGFKTAEIRIGEMTFDYSLLMKRIIHCNEIIKKLKSIMISDYNGLNLEFSKNQENQIKEVVNPDEIVNNRIIKRY